jgi:glycine/D-amino acid oxidase-like deaminating enzyme
MTVTFSPETEAWIAERERKGDDCETKAWLAEREREALLIDPATAEVHWSFGQTLDPYGTIPDLLEELQQVGREYFARLPGSDIWVHFGDLPDEVREKLRKHPNAKPTFTDKTNGEVIWNIDLPEGLEPLF